MHVICYSRSFIVWQNKKDFIDEKLHLLYDKALEGNEEKHKGKAVAIVSEV